MAQISIFDKSRHYSNKEFTCSIGARNMIYMSFRHDSWKHFTDSDYMAIATKPKKGKGESVLVFGDPEKGASGAVFKLGAKQGETYSRLHTRYIQIDGTKHPEILAIIRERSGSYDFGIEVAGEEAPKEEPKPSKKEEAVKELRKALENYKPNLEVIDAEEEKLARFKADLKYHLSNAQSPLERVEVWRALSALYGIHGEPINVSYKDAFQV